MTTNSGSKTLGDRTERIELPENLDVGEKFTLPVTESFSRQEEIYSVNTLGKNTYIKTMEENSGEEVTTHRNYIISNGKIQEASAPQYYDNLKRTFVN